MSDEFNILSSANLRQIDTLEICFNDNTIQLDFFWRSSFIVGVSAILSEICLQDLILRVRKFVNFLGLMFMLLEKFLAKLGWVVLYRKRWPAGGN